jgi:hypothetical protein
VFGVASSLGLAAAERSAQPSSRHCGRVRT